MYNLARLRNCEFRFLEKQFPLLKHVRLDDTYNQLNDNKNCISEGVSDSEVEDGKMTFMNDSGWKGKERKSYDGSRSNECSEITVR